MEISDIVFNPNKESQVEHLIQKFVSEQLLSHKNDMIQYSKLVGDLEFHQHDQSFPYGVVFLMLMLDLNSLAVKYAQKHCDDGFTKLLKDCLGRKNHDLVKRKADKYL